MKLFDGTVTPTFLYGCAAWTLTGDLKKRIQATQRRMLRMIIQTPPRKNKTTPDVNTQDRTPHQEQQQTAPTAQTAQTAEHILHEQLNQDHSPRRPDTQLTRHHDDTIDSSSTDDVDSNTSNTNTTHNHDDTTEEKNDETWVEWIRRATHEAENSMAKIGMKSWLDTQKVMKWKWAYKLANKATDSWALRLAKWSPQLHGDRCRVRKQARPKRRWEDDINQFLDTTLGTKRTDWHEIAQCNTHNMSRKNPE